MDDSTRQLVDSFRTDDDGIFSLTRSDTTRFSLISLCSNKRYCRRQSDVEHGFLIILLTCKHLLIIQAWDTVSDRPILCWYKDKMRDSELLLISHDQWQIGLSEISTAGCNNTFSSCHLPMSEELKHWRSWVFRDLGHIPISAGFIFGNRLRLPQNGKSWCLKIAVLMWLSVILSKVNINWVIPRVGLDWIGSSIYIQLVGLCCKNTTHVYSWVVLLLRPLIGYLA